MLISVENLSKSFADRIILENTSFAVEDSDRIGLIGPNGSGKSTLLNLIIGKLESDGGNITYSSNITIGYLEQKPKYDKKITIYDEMKNVFSDLLAVLNEIKDIENQMSKSENNSELMHKYSTKQEYFEKNDGYLIDVKIKTVLNGMGFGDRMFDSDVSVLSGGEKTRLSIAKLLLTQPKLLLLDEPTNHLDFKTLTWLEEYILEKYRGAIIVVSHDRYFLDKVSTCIFELNDNQIVRYTGNYSKYLILKESRIETELKEFEKQQKVIGHMEDYIARNSARASTATMAKSRQKSLDKIERIKKPKTDKKKANFDFPMDREPYKEVLNVKNLTLSIDGSSVPLIENIDFFVKRGQKIAIVGENGVGKTTFLKTILKAFNSQSRKSIEWGGNVKISYFDQESKNLDKEKTAIDELWDRNRLLTETQIRNILGRVLLTGDNVYKKTGQLSGGERAKLCFAIIEQERSNVIILDEPTNHLDLDTKEQLEKALMNYKGTIICVSHDRYLLNKIPDQISEFKKDSNIINYKGGYDSYLEQSAKASAMTIEKSESDIIAAVSKTVASSSGYKSKQLRSLQAKIKKEMQELETEIEKLEAVKSSLEDEIQTKEVFENYQLMAEKCEQLESIKTQITMLTDRWLEASENA